MNNDAIAATVGRRSILQLAAGAGAALVVAPRLAFAQSDPRLAALHDKARAEGQITWYIAHISSEEAEQMGRQFTAAYPGVRVNIVRATGQVVYQKLNQDLRAGSTYCDVFSSTDLGQYVALGGRNLLAAYEPLVGDGLRPIFRGYDPAHRVHVTNTDFSTLLYNTAKVQPADAPRKWTDLLDPKWRGQVAMAHPAYSGSMGTWTYLIDKIYGWSYFEKLAANKPQVGRSLIDPATTIASGERIVGIGPSDLILDLGARGNPVAIVYPEDGSNLMVGPTSILQNAPHPNAARLFLEWLLGPQASEFSAKQHRLPVCAAIAPLAGVKNQDEIAIIQANGDELVKGIPRIVEKWRDTFGV